MTPWDVNSHQLLSRFKVHRNVLEESIGSIGTHTQFSIAYHVQTNGQSKCTIRTLEDMLRACTVNFKGSQGNNLSLVEFVYNNSYNKSIEMAHFEAIYSRKCKSLLHQDKVGEWQLTIPKLVQTSIEVMAIICG